MKKRVISALLVAALGLTVFAGCSETSEKQDETEIEKEETEDESESSEKKELSDKDFFNQTTHLNIALQPIPGYLPVTVLQDKGWVEEALKEAGYDDVEVNYTEFESGPLETEALAAGSQDIGVMGNVPTISGVANGLHIYILGVAYNGEKTEAVIVPNGSNITSVSELKGKNVGLVVGSIAQDYLYRLLEKEGFSLDDVQLVDVSLSEQLEALSTGRVDAVVTWQPTLAKAESQKIGKVLVDGTGIYKCENLISGNMEYIELNPEIVQIFFQQYARAVSEVSNNRRAYAEEYADKYGLDASLVESILKDITYQVSVNDDDILDFQATADWLCESGIVSKQLNVKDCVYDMFANDASVAEYLN